MKNSKDSYFVAIKDAISTSFTGIRLTLKHIFSSAFNKRHSNTTASDKNYFLQEHGIVTLRYPYEALPVPDNGRYRLHNEIEDCIVCDKCAKICPVNCIEIEAIKATEQIGTASDGTPIRLHAARFDIDMAKCCFCGLCTTVCPTECLTMTPNYDFSEFDVRNMIYQFSEMTPEEAEQKRQLYEVQQQNKKESQPAQPPATGPKRPAFKPKVQPLQEAETLPEQTENSSGEAASENQVKKRPVFKKPASDHTTPVAEPETKPEQQPEQQAEVQKSAKTRPVFKRPAVETEAEDKQTLTEQKDTPEQQPEQQAEVQKTTKARPVFKRPAVETTAEDKQTLTEQKDTPEQQPEQQAEVPKTAKARPVFKRPAVETETEDKQALTEQKDTPEQQPEQQAEVQKTAKARPVFKRPVIEKPPGKDEDL